MEVRFLFDDTSLWVGARMHSAPGTGIQAPMSRRDDGSQAEYIEIELDTYLDRRTAYMFGVTASGVRLDHFHPTDNEDDTDSQFDPVWEARTRIDSDGWTAELWKSGRCGDRTTAFFNPFRNNWVINIRESFPPGYRGRAKRYWEVDDINDPAAVAWPAQDQAPLWVTADRGLDAPEPTLGVAPQLYHLDCVGYESVLLGLFSILRGNYHADGGEGLTCNGNDAGRRSLLPPFGARGRDLRAVPRPQPRGDAERPDRLRQDPVRRAHGVATQAAAHHDLVP